MGLFTWQCKLSTDNVCKKEMIFSAQVALLVPQIEKGQYFLWNFVSLTPHPHPHSESNLQNLRNCWLNIFPNKSHNPITIGWEHRNDTSANWKWQNAHISWIPSHLQWDPMTNFRNYDPYLKYIFSLIFKRS